MPGPCAVCCYPCSCSTERLLVSWCPVITRPGDLHACSRQLCWLGKSTFRGRGIAHDLTIGALIWNLQAMAELLTTNKLSELACLTLYLMYEKKNGRQSVWYEFIKVRAFCLGST